MGILASPWYFSNCSHNHPASPIASTGSGTFHTSGTSNADGTAAALLSALAHDAHYLVIGLGGPGSGTVNPLMLTDILIDPAGGTSWSTFIDDLNGAGGSTTISAGQGGIHTWYHFPIFVKSGASLGIRSRSAHGSGQTVYCLIFAFGNPSNPEMWWCGSGVESLGVTPASSVGTSVTPGNSGAYGSWTDIAASTHPYGAVVASSSPPDNNTTAQAVFYQVGYGGQKLPGSPTLYYNQNANETAVHGGMQIPIWCNVAASTTWQIRAASSAASAEAGNFAVYGVY